MTRPYPLGCRLALIHRIEPSWPGGTIVHVRAYSIPYSGARRYLVVDAEGREFWVGGNDLEQVRDQELLPEGQP